VLIAVLNRFAYGIYCRRKFEESAFRFAINMPLIKQVSHFSFWMGFGTVGGILKDQVGNVILNMFFGVTLNSARAVSSQVQTVISQIGSSLGTPIAPQITKSYALGDKGRAISLTLFLGKIEGYLSSAIAIPLILETKYVLNLWLKEPPQYSVEFVRWSLVLTVLNIISGAYGPLYWTIEKIAGHGIHC
jgi:O-antigen/teichoic acid export membrane protein